MPIRNVIICVLAFTLLMAIVTILVVRSSLKEVPSQLMRPKSPKVAKKMFIENIDFIWRRLSFTTKVTIRNIVRYKGRFFMTVIGVAGCTALLVLGWGIKDSISEVVSIQYGDIFNYDYTINLEDDTNIDEMVVALESDLDNEYVVSAMSYSSLVYFDDGDSKAINAVVIDARDASDIFNFRDADDHKTEVTLKNSGVIISEKFANNYDISVGDYITVESSNGYKAEVKVAAICEMYFQHYMFISEEYYESIFGESVHSTCVLVKNTTEEGIEESIEDIDGFINVADFNSMTEQFNTMIEALNYIILVIIIAAGSLALVVLINLTQVNISERIREIATLKVLGFREGEITSYIFKEVFLLSIIGALVGMPLGMIEHRFVMFYVINMEMIMFGRNVKLASYLYAFGITIIFTVIVMFLTRKSLREVEMVESLKSVE